MDGTPFVGAHFFWDTQYNITPVHIIMTFLGLFQNAPSFYAFAKVLCRLAYTFEIDELYRLRIPCDRMNHFKRTSDGFISEKWVAKYSGYFDNRTDNQCIYAVFLRNKF